MVVLSLTDVPQSLRGDLSKWMTEINTGVFVGSFGARVRDELWERVCENIKNGKATMVYSVRGEQGMDFRVHNTTWKPVDYDGIKLIKKVFNPTNTLTPGFSKAAKYRKIKKIRSAKHTDDKIRMTGDETEEIIPSCGEDIYTVIDIETTGLRPARDEITEIAAIRYDNGAEKSCFCKLIRIKQNLSDGIVALTGITNEILSANGEECSDVIREFINFLGDSEIVCHNAAFDMAFINHACEEYDIPKPNNKINDTLEIAKKELNNLNSYKLCALAQYFGISETQSHRADSDCRLTAQIYEKLKEMKQS